MTALAIAGLLGSVVSMFAVGAATIAPRTSFLRSKTGMLLLVMVVLSLVTIPPSLTMFDLSKELPMLAWPANFSKGLYNGIWVVSSIVGLLVGMQIWRMGKPGYREGSALSDASAVSRVSSLMPLADSLDKALDVLVQARLTERDVPRVAEDVRGVGRKLAASLPPSDGALYSMVAAKLPAPVAAAVTGYLLEGAGRRGARQG